MSVAYLQDYQVSVESKIFNPRIFEMNLYPSRRSSGNPDFTALASRVGSEKDKKMVRCEMARRNR